MAKGKSQDLEIKNSDSPLTRDESLYVQLVSAYISKGCGDSQALKEADKMLPCLKDKLWPKQIDAK